MLGQWGDESIGLLLLCICGVGVDTASSVCGCGGGGGGVLVYPTMRGIPTLI